MATRSCVIVGGGISGLSTAYRLSRMASSQALGLAITVLESGVRAGGVIQSRSEEGFLLESGPDAFLSDKPWAVDLCRELGLEKEMVGTQPDFRRSFIVRQGKLVPVPEGWYLVAPGSLRTLLRSPLLTLGGKLRMACEPFIPPRLGEEDESVAAFVRRRFGQQALERIAQPMIGGITTAPTEQLSLLAAVPQLREMEKSHGSVTRALRGRGAATAKASGPRYSLFVTLRAGMQQLVDALIAAMPSVTLRTQAAVIRIERGAQGEPWKIHLTGGEAIAADALCLALPAPAAAPIVASVSQPLATALSAISYASVATVNLAFAQADVPHPLNGFGIVIPAQEQRQAVGITFASVKFAGRAPQGSVLVRIFIAGAAFPQGILPSSEELIRIAREEIRGLLGIDAEPKLASAARYPASMPQYAVGHFEQVAAIERLVAGEPGLFLSGNGLRGLGIPDCVRQATESAGRIMTYLKST